MTEIKKNLNNWAECKFQDLLEYIGRAPRRSDRRARGAGYEPRGRRDRRARSGPDRVVGGSVHARRERARHQRGARHERRAPRARELDHVGRGRARAPVRVALASRC